jgi:hypothetical protein
MVRDMISILLSKLLVNFRQTSIQKTYSVLPFNGENFRTISFNCFEFVDTLAFLQAPLSELCSDLKDTGHNYDILKTNLFSSNKWKI